MQKSKVATEDTRGYLPYLRALILLQCDNSDPVAILHRAGFAVEEIAELCDMRVPAVWKRIHRDRTRSRRPT